MKTITVRDLRQRWPAAEKALDAEHEIIVTRDGQPVAKLVRIVSQSKRRKKFDPNEHARRQQKLSGGRHVRWVEEFLIKERGEL